MFNSEQLRLNLKFVKLETEVKLVMEAIRLNDYNKVAHIYSWLVLNLSIFGRYVECRIFFTSRDGFHSHWKEGKFFQLLIAYLDRKFYLIRKGRWLVPIDIFLPI